MMRTHRVQLRPVILVGARVMLIVTLSLTAVAGKWEWSCPHWAVVRFTNQRYVCEICQTRWTVTGGLDSPTPFVDPIATSAKKVPNVVNGAHLSSVGSWQ